MFLSSILYLFRFLFFIFSFLRNKKKIESKGACEMKRSKQKRSNFLEEKKIPLN
jgi:hypothetical protein